MNEVLDRNNPNRVLRVLIGGVAIAVCLLLIWTTGRVALSRMLLHFAMEAASGVAANAAVGLSPSDAEARMVHGALLKASGDLAGAISELEYASSLRPRDYYTWLELGMARDQANNIDGAITAFNEAVRLAPYYARPLWLRGNLYLREQRYEEAFRDLQAAAASNPELERNLIDLAWSLSQSDVKVAADLAQVNTLERHLLFARYLVDKGKPREALEHFRSAAPTSEEDRKDFIAQLILRKSFNEAYQIWSNTRVDGNNSAIIHDGGFEGSLSLDESGFGWRIPKSLRGANLSFDTDQPQSGIRSLHVEYSGESAPEAPVVSQLVIVKPSTSYNVSFATRTKSVVTGGLPLMKVVDAEGKQVLGRSVAIQQGDNEWQSMVFTFTTGPATSAVVLNLERENCTSQPCPAFGALWLDSFGIQIKE